MWGRRRGVNLIDTAEMDAFFARLDHLNQEQLLSLSAAWRSMSSSEHEDAWTAVRAVGARDGLTKEVERVRKKALAWSTRGSDAFPYSINTEIAWSQSKMEAGEAIVDAALAVALGGHLDPQIHDVLIEPWLRATEPQE
jgi:hypothetical protein